MGSCRFSRGRDVSRPHPGDAAAAPSARKSTRKRVRSTRVAGPEWAECAACIEKPKSKISRMREA
jgi:hypothetical protein